MKKTSWIVAITALYLYATIIVDTLRIIGLQFVPVLHNNIELIRNCIYIVILLCSIRLCIKKKLPKFLFVLLAIEIIISLYSYILNPEIHSIFGQYLVMLVSRMLPGFILLYYCEDYKGLTDLLTKWWIIPIVYSLVGAMWGISREYIAFSYNLLLPAILFLVTGMNQKNGMLVLAGILIGSIMFIWGSRGATLCLIVAITLYIMFNGQVKLSYKLLIILALVLALFTIYFIFYDKLIILLYQKFPTSRTIRKLFNGVISNDSGRERLYDLLLNRIAQSPFNIRGILADRIALTDAFHSGEISLNAYSHNIIIEVLYQHGIILGGVVLIYLAFLICKSFMICKSNNRSSFCIWCCFVPFAFVQLIFTASYLTDYMFAVAVSFMYIVIRRNEHSNKKNRWQTDE